MKQAVMLFRPKASNSPDLCKCWNYAGLPIKSVLPIKSGIRLCVRVCIPGIAIFIHQAGTREEGADVGWDQTLILVSDRTGSRDVWAAREVRAIPGLELGLVMIAAPKDAMA
jgi:hypothetical protein